VRARSARDSRARRPMTPSSARPRSPSPPSVASRSARGIAVSASRAETSPSRITLGRSRRSHRPARSRRATRTATPAPVEARTLHTEPLPLRIILEVRMLGEGACRHPRISWGSLPRFRANFPTALALSLPPGLAEAAPDPCPLAGHRREARAMSTAARRLMLRGVDRSTILSAHRGRTSCPPWSRSTPEAGRVDRAAPRPPQWTC
jgi:hypothetical protein